MFWRRGLAARVRQLGAPAFQASSKHSRFPPPDPPSTCPYLRRSPSPRPSVGLAEGTEAPSKGLQGKLSRGVCRAAVCSWKEVQNPENMWFQLPEQGSSLRLLHSAGFPEATSPFLGCS